MLVTQSSECDMRANQWEACGKCFLSPKTDRQNIFMCGRDPGTAVANLN